MNIVSIAAYTSHISHCGKQLRPHYAILVLVTMTAAGCSMLDYRLLEACRVDHSTGEYYDRQRCLAAQGVVRQEKEYKRKAAEEAGMDAAKKRREEAEGAAREAEYHRKIKAIQSTPEYKRREALGKAEALKTHADWKREYKLKLPDQREILARYPDIAWMNGIWCWKGGDYRDGLTRYEVLQNGRIRTTRYRSVSPMGTTSSDGTRVTFHSVRIEKILSTKNKYMHYLTEIPNADAPAPYDSPGAYFDEVGLFRFSDQQHRMDGKRHVRSISNTTPPRVERETSVGANYVRCDTE